MTACSCPVPAHSSCAGIASNDVELSVDSEQQPSVFLDEKLNSIASSDVELAVENQQQPSVLLNGKLENQMRDTEAVLPEDEDKKHQKEFSKPCETAARLKDLEIGIKSMAEKDVRKPHPLDSAGFFTKVVLGWLSPLIWLASERPIEESDVWDAPLVHGPKANAPKFQAAWQAELAAARISGRRQPSVARAVFHTFKRRILTNALVLFSFACSLLAQPFFIRGLMRFMNDGNSKEEVGVGIAYASAMLICSALSSILISNYGRVSKDLGVHVKTSLMCTIFEHSMHLSASARLQTSVGQTTNLLSVDSERVFLAMNFMHFVWVAPFLAVAVGIILAIVIGPTALVGLGLIILQWPLQHYMAKFGGRARKKAMVCTDDRVKFIAEVVKGIRIMKVYCWEEAMLKRVSQLRRVEVRWLSTSIFLKACTREGILILLPPVILSAIFLIERARGVHVEQATALMVLGFLNLLRFPFNLLSAALAACQDAGVSCSRIQEFLQRPVLAREFKSSEGGALVEVSDAVFKWAALDGNSPFSLTVDSLHLTGGDKVAIIGRVAAGKSSLLAGLLGEMQLTNGKCDTRGCIAYLGQSPWIQNMSVRDNVLFGHEFDLANYERALMAASLGPDLETLKDGDLTQIGERGISLSGGQKARVGLARCLYAVAIGASNALVLDCPFDALDAETGQHVFNGMMELAGDALLICCMSAQIHLLPRFDSFVVVEGGRASFFQSLSKVASHCPELVKSTANADNVEDASKRPAGLADLSKDQAKLPPTSQGARNSARLSLASAGGGLMKADKNKSGGLSWSLLLSHVGSAAGGGAKVGVCLICVLLSIFLVGQGLRVGSDIMLTKYASATLAAEVAFCTLASCAVFLALRIASVSIVSGRASVAVHRKTFWHMIRAPITEYFDVTTSGEIINKFAKDLDTADTLLPESCMQFLSNSSQILTVIAISTYAVPWFLGVLAALAVIFYFVGIRFSRASRDLKRLDGSTRSPVYNAFSETLGGLETIRAWRAQDRFLEEFNRRLLRNLSCFHAVSMSESWVMCRLESITFTIIGAFAFSAVSMRGHVEPELVGLALVYAIQLTAMLQRTVQLITLVSQQATACERVLSFVSVPQEPPLALNGDQTLPAGWPSGEVAFEGVKLKYRDGDLVLKGVSFTARAGERVGVCGRTGAGKSTVLSALFRTVELCGGSIRIDGVDICTLGLKTLRNNLSIIPQEPLLFSGSIRYNLDPFDSVKDDKTLMDVMSLVGLEDAVKSAGGLRGIVAEHGENFSQGQRQLMCIARVMVRRTRITALDEATSAMDAETDRDRKSVV